MKKALSLSLAVVITSMLLSMVAGPAELAAAQGRPDDAGPPEGRGRAVLGPPFMNETSGSCSIDCGDGRTFETDAGSVIQCACDCASVCGGTCEATNGEETRTCSAN